METLELAFEPSAMFSCVALYLTRPSQNLRMNMWGCCCLLRVSFPGGPQERGFSPQTPTCPRLETAGEEHPGDFEPAGTCCRYGTCLLTSSVASHPQTLLTPQLPMQQIARVGRKHYYHQTTGVIVFCLQAA